MGKINEQNAIFSSMYNEYCTPKPFALSRIKTDFNQEIKTKNEYQGREIYELIQNADDQDASHLHITLDTRKRQLKVANDGDKPFSEEGYCSIMLADSSPKIFAKLIGQKGLGFRSILNWADSVTITSNGVMCEFSPVQAFNSWEDIKKKLDPEVVADLERLSRKNGRKCPIPILAIPHVVNHENDPGIAAEIKIDYFQESQQSILEQLNSLSPQVLLFLRCLQQIEIKVDDESPRILKRESLQAEEFSGIKTVRINQECWHFLERAGQLDENDKDSNYQVAVAYKDGQVDMSSNYVYCFFPTKVLNPYNCVIHATFELSQSRKEILDNNTNRRLFSIVADTMVELSNYVAKSSGEVNWLPYSIVSRAPHTTSSLPEIESCLENRLNALPILPAVSGNYVTLNDSDYVSDRFANFLMEIRKDSQASEVFGNHLTPVPADIKFDRRGCEDFVDKLNELSPFIKDVPLRAELIHELSLSCEYRDAVSNGNYPNLLVDDDNKVITDCGYLNTGERIPNIPDFINFHYVNEELALKLKELFSVNSSRSLCEPNALGEILNISYQDKNKVIAKILPTSDDAINTVRQRIKCLYEYFLESGDVASDSLTARVKLPNAEDNLTYAEELVLYEKEYPNGVENMNIQIASSWKLAPPEYWDINVEDWHQYERFWCGIGVSLYVPKEKKSVVADKLYLESCDIKGSELSCFGHMEKDPKNYARIPVEKYLNELTLRDILCLLVKDVAIKDSIPKSEIRYYYYNKKIFSRTLPESYVAYYLQQSIGPIKDLKGYVISADISPKGVKLDYDYFKSRKITRRDIQTLISHLGAVDDPEELTVEQLYGILENQPNTNKDAEQIQKIYSLIKKALNVKKDDGQKLSVPRGLKLYARKSGEIKGEYLPYRDVYYWDNDRLPKKFLEDKPKLEIGHRVGERQVKEIFGVKIPEENNFKIVEGERNEYFERILGDYILSRIKYILAFRSDEIKQPRLFSATRKSIETMIFHCYRKCKFVIGTEGEILELGHNEMVVTKSGSKSVFNICHSGTDAEAAFRIPQFCAAITEAVAITMKLKTDYSEFLDAVTTILSGDERMNEYFVQRKLGDDAETILKRFSETRIEKKARAQGERFSALLHLREEYKDNFIAYIFDQVKGSVETQKTFRTKVLEFCDNQWLMDLSNEMLDDADIRAGLNNKVQALYNITLEDLDLEYADRPIQQMDEYAEYIGGVVHLPDDIVSLSYFAGNERLIIEFRDKYLAPDTEDDRGDSSGETREPNQTSVAPQEMHSASWTEDPQERYYSEKSSELGGMRPRKRRQSDSQALQRGEEATDIVIASMKNHPELYDNIVRVDENGDRLAGTDAHHYDIQYYDKVEARLRYLEVKSLQGNECTLTPMEHKTGVDNADLYDIAFVRNGKPYFFKSPFKDPRFKECIWPTDYTINVVNLKLEDK